MNDYIKRENALNAFNNAFYSGLAAKIKEIPSEDVEQVRHGWWKDLDDTEFRVNGWYCSECSYVKSCPCVLKRGARLSVCYQNTAA